MGNNVVLVHGWDFRYYSEKCGVESGGSVAWRDRRELVELLSGEYKLHYYSLPGFCGEREPRDDNWDVENFADDLDSWIKMNGISPKLIIGYSFGGAVALEYKLYSSSRVPIVLVSPAIVRSKSIWSKFGGLIGERLGRYDLDQLRSVYQYIFSKYYREGTPFLRKTYDKIVRSDLRSELEKVGVAEILLIYGVDDNVTPWSLVESIVKDRGMSYQLIDGGGHNIGQTHPEEICEAISWFMERL